MSEEEKRTVNFVKKYLDDDEMIYQITNEDIVVLLNLVDKQNKVIDEMIEEYEFNERINVKDFCEECQRKDKCIQDCHTHIKQYFIRKVEEELMRQIEEGDNYE